MRLLRWIFGITNDLIKTKLEKALGKELKEVFYYHGFEYTHENVIKFKKLLNQKSLERWKVEAEFDVNKDNLEIYFTVSLNEEKNIYLLIDYYNMSATYAALIKS